MRNKADEYKEYLDKSVVTMGRSIASLLLKAGYRIDGFRLVFEVPKK